MHRRLRAIWRRLQCRRAGLCRADVAFLRRGATILSDKILPQKNTRIECNYCVRSVFKRSLAVRLSKTQRLAPKKSGCLRAHGCSRRWGDNEHSGGLLAASGMHTAARLPAWNGAPEGRGQISSSISSSRASISAEILFQFRNGAPAAMSAFSRCSMARDWLPMSG